jgi:hypothetical protein
VQSEDQMKVLKQHTVDFLIAIAPRGWKRLFCDYEWHDGETAYVGSEVTVAVVKKWLREVTCTSLNLAEDGRVITNFMQLAKNAMEANASPHCTIELIVRSKDDHEWHVDFSAPPRLSATLVGDLEATHRNPELKKRYRKFAARDEWLAKIP